MVVILVIMRIAVGKLCSVVTSRSGELWLAEQSFIFGHIILPTWLCLPPSKQSGIIGTLSWRHDGTEGLARFFILDSVSDHLPITSSFQWGHYIVSCWHTFFSAPCVHSSLYTTLYNECHQSGDLRFHRPSSLLETFLRTWQSSWSHKSLLNHFFVEIYWI